MMTTDTRRRCACGTVLSQYNAADTCYACQDRQRAHSSQPWRLAFDGRAKSPTKEYKPAWARRTSGDIDDDQERMMQAIRQHTHDAFRVAELYEHLPGMGRGTLSHLMVRAERQGLVCQVREERGPTGGIVRVWSLVERSREEVALR